ncbi:hypothetical protein HUG20_10990 [Salicibibacter cibi]|uniref:Uncharacterized protein n=1 Tax=Salicibibacter cibi TaxID=2743001 RepID=A0A7T6ZC79_9BACI|nr:hypothetical protein [Salicibibacter cibi]QQK80366.1 hypothetical protein HUG20_10990 [Salicibibacter cibi]
MLQWRDSSGKTDASSPRSAGFCARRLDRSSTESEAMEAASWLRLIAACYSAIPAYFVRSSFYQKHPGYTLAPGAFDIFT